MTELAGGVLLDEKGRVLLLHRNTQWLKQWQLPGGKVEPDESPADTVARELKEELGIDVQTLEQIGIGKFEQTGKAYRYSWFSVQQTDPRQKPQVLEADHDKCEYFSLQEIKLMPDASPNLLKLANLLEAK